MPSRLIGTMASNSSSSSSREVWGNRGRCEVDVISGTVSSSGHFITWQFTALKGSHGEVHQSHKELMVLGLRRKILEQSGGNLKSWHRKHQMYSFNLIWNKACAGVVLLNPDAWPLYMTLIRIIFIIISIFIIMTVLFREGDRGALGSAFGKNIVPPLRFPFWTLLIVSLSI